MIASRVGQRVRRRSAQFRIGLEGVPTFPANLAERLRDGEPTAAEAEVLDASIAAATAELRRRHGLGLRVADQADDFEEE